MKQTKITVTDHGVVQFKDRVRRSSRVMLRSL